MEEEASASIVKRLGGGKGRGGGEKVHIDKLKYSRDK